MTAARQRAVTDVYLDGILAALRALRRSEWIRTAEREQQQPTAHAADQRGEDER